MKISGDDIWKGLALGALAASGLGLAGIGPLAGLLGGSAASGAGAAGAGATAAGAAGTAGAGSAGTAAAAGGLTAKEMLGASLATNALGMGVGEAMPKYGMKTPVQTPQIGGGMDFAQLLQPRQMSLPRLNMR